jgi:2,4-dienoyl-CoA reductase-like NADH-dependent reductase (Old Yellow Enzyme family)
MPTPLLFEAFTLRSVTLRNRIGVSPMCQYSCEGGIVGDWHFVHLGSRAVGGAGLVMAEATAVSAEGRISPSDTGIWSDAHTDAWRRIVGFIVAHGSVPGIQLAHAGWKGSTAAPWKGGKAVAADAGGWQPIGVGDVPFTDGYPVPRMLTEADIDRVCGEWRDVAERRPHLVEIPAGRHDAVAGIQRRLGDPSSDTAPGTGDEPHLAHDCPLTRRSRRVGTDRR